MKERAQMKLHCSVFATLFTLLGSLLPTPQTAKVTALVVDEISGEPIEGAMVSGVFEIECNPWERVKGSPSPNIDRKQTDKDGRCILTGKTNNGEVSCLLRGGIDSHYWVMQGGGYTFKSKNLFGAWQPDNVVVTIKLQRVEHPIPLWVKRELLNVKREIANINGGKFSYDLMMGEWLPPFGKGKFADMEFTRIPHQDFGEVVGVAGVKGHSYRDAVSVKFVGADNGLVECKPPSGSCLKIRTAPEDGYKPDYECWRGKGSDLKYEMSYDEKRCFSFRIRTRRNDKGEIVEAYYGKIYSDIKIYTGYDHGIHGVLFAYYFNPASLDRNLEWDRVNNLCPNPGDVGHSVGERQP